MQEKEWGNIAEDYFENLSSPFEDDVINPIFDIVSKMTCKKNMAVVDLGTGIGNFIPFLESNFNDVTVVDFSKKMLEIAEKKSKKSSTKILKKDLRNLNGIYNKFDITFAINSILMPSINDVKKALKETRKTLKKNGKLIAVFPSLESVLYKAMIAHDYELTKKSEKAAKEKTRIEIEHEKYDFLFGLVDEEGEQKHYYKFEIEHRLKEAGFQNLKFMKIEYPWKNFCEKYFLKFKNKPKLWDWLIVAEK